MVVVGALLGCKALDDYKQKKAAAASAAPAASAAASTAKGDETSTGGATRPDGFALKKLAVGQYVEYRMRGDGNLKRYAWAVVGKEDGLLWMQLVSDVENQEYAMQMLVDAQDATQIDNAKPKKIRFKMPNGKVQEIGGRMLAMSNQMTKKNRFFIDMTEEKVAAGAREDVKVKSGSFPGAFKWKGSTKYDGKRNVTTFWSHPSVPITGIVKANDGRRTWELSSYGEKGAKKEF